MTSSWLPIPPTSPFSLQNLPYAIASTPTNHTPRPFTALGSHAIDLSILSSASLFSSIPNLPPDALTHSTLNPLMSCPYQTRLLVRKRLLELFKLPGDPVLKTDLPLRTAAIIPLESIQLHFPARIGDYTDFYSSKEHATNVGTMFRGPSNALQPNWMHLPVGYHGRSSTVFLSGHDVRRPCGQLQKNKDDPAEGPIFGPTKLLDFELEMGIFVGGPPTPPGHRLTVSDARRKLFGFVLMNDWSARDIQKWEYVPLGPFGGKNFATTISGWVVTPEALEPFTCQTSAGIQDDPVPLAYLRDDNYSSYDIELTVKLRGETMDQPEIVSKTNYRNMYWNAVQQLVHHSVTGCVMNPGDLLGTGTISGQTPTSLGSMLELCWKGTREVKLGDSGHVRKFLQDGDDVIMEGVCVRDGVGRVGFGECRGTILPAIKDPMTLPQTEEEAAKQDDRYINTILYGYWRSTSTWRVRIALAAKKIPYIVIPVNLLEGEQFRRLEDKSPMNQIPVLECYDTLTKQTVKITQSVAIIEFIHEAFSHRVGSLFPNNPLDRAAVREISEIINSGIQPLQNLSLINKLEQDSEGKISKKQFAKDVIEKGLLVVEALVQHKKGMGGPYAIGNFQPTLADALIVPQLYNARRYGVDLESTCPKLLEIETICKQHEWFVEACPEKQPDAVKEG